MLDIIAAIALTALFGLVTAVLITSTPVAAPRVTLALIALGWFAGVSVLGALGIFSATGTGTPAVGAALVVPLAVATWVVRHSPAARALAFDTPLSWLVALHTGRIFGGFFLVLLGAGRLPPTFALIAGWGDIIVAATAVPVAWAIHRRASGWRPLTMAWNSVGTLDLVSAIALGVGSAPDSPLQFLFEPPTSALMGGWPWVLVPGLMVPLYLLTHAAVFAQLAREGAPQSGGAHAMPPVQPRAV